MQTQIRSSSPALAAQSGTGIKVYSYAVIGALIYIVGLVLALLFNAAETEWVTGLFLIPPFASIIGVGIHVQRGTPTKDHYFYDFSMKVSFFSTLFYCFLWVLYCFGVYSQILSIVSLFGIAVLLFLIGLMMCAFLHDMDGDKWPRLLALRNGASNEQLWALCFLFFVLFLDVAYLFGFAFAFHDRRSLASSHTPALHMTSFVSPDDFKAAMPSSSPADHEKAIAAELPAADNRRTAVNPIRATEDPNFYFYFDTRRARLEKPEDGQCERLPNEDIQPPQRLSWVARDTKEFNYCTLEAIKLRLERETTDGNRVRIILVGRSDDRPIKKPDPHMLDDQFLDYKSNYELSEARAENVRFEIIRALKDQDRSPRTWLNLEWLSLPSSNEVPIEADQHLQRILEQTDLDPSKKETFIDRNKRVVVASIVSIPGEITALQMKGMWPRSLNLMDYMYFSIYTITTTGYGDIIPTTGYAKFVVSLANICEVLFLVVFVNALISLKVKKKIRRRSSNGKPTDSVL
jgi:Ion channel